MDKSDQAVYHENRSRPAVERRRRQQTSTDQRVTSSGEEYQYYGYEQQFSQDRISSRVPATAAPLHLSQQTHQRGQLPAQQLGAQIPGEHQMMHGRSPGTGGYFPSQQHYPSQNYPQQTAVGPSYQVHQQNIQMSLSSIGTIVPDSQYLTTQYFPQQRHPSQRPIVKSSLNLIDTYKKINEGYFEERKQRKEAQTAHKREQGDQKVSGVYNNGWDDEHYDYIITAGEVIYDRYEIKERIGKGSFGQVVQAYDRQSMKDVAIKIIKSKKPFQLQARTEIELLTHLKDKDRDDNSNIGKFYLFRYRRQLKK